jgi:hypothetical protein
MRPLAKDAVTAGNRCGFQTRRDGQDRVMPRDVNRFFRRMQRFGKSFSVRRSQAEMRNTQHEVFDAHTPQDVTSVRAKSSGHGKKTADKWNQ